MFSILTEAYDVLSDPVQRARYDASLDAPAAGPVSEPEPEPVADSWLVRPSTAAQRRRAVRRMRQGRVSWHLTPSQYLSAVGRRLRYTVIVVVLGILLAVLRNL